MIFWDVMPCSAVASFPPACLLILAEIISSTLKMEAICSSETSVATQQTTRRHIPEDDTLHNHRCENLKSYIYVMCFAVKHSEHSRNVFPMPILEEMFV
jgi:hypothetical protein